MVTRVIRTTCFLWFDPPPLTGFSIGIDFVEKKLGVHLSREQNEEYSDKARELYEKEVSQF